jgi:hypothetical protein
MHKKLLSRSCHSAFLANATVGIGVGDEVRGDVRGDVRRDVRADLGGNVKGDAGGFVGGGSVQAGKQTLVFERRASTAGYTDARFRNMLLYIFWL